MLVAEALAYRYGGMEADLFANASLEIPAGTTCAIVGPSGVGKSTLLALLSGVLLPRIGHVSLDGSPIRLDELLRRSGWITQMLDVQGSRTVIDNATMVARIDGMPEPTASHRALRAFEELGLTVDPMARARTLSGGELQRLTVVRAMISDRPLLFADEPTNQLDAVAANLVADYLTVAQRRDRIAIVVTHDLAVARRCDQTLALTAAGLEPLQGS